MSQLNSILISLPSNTNTNVSIHILESSFKKLQNLTNGLIENVIQTQTSMEQLYHLNEDPEKVSMREPQLLVSSVSQIIGTESWPSSLFPLVHAFSSSSSLSVVVRLEDLLPIFKEKMVRFFQMESLYERAQCFDRRWISLVKREEMKQSQEENQLFNPSEKRHLADMFRFNQSRFNSTPVAEQEEQCCLQMGSSLVHVVNVVSSFCSPVCTQRCQKLCSEIDACLKLMKPFPIVLCSVLISSIHLFLVDSEKTNYCCVYFEQSMSLTYFLTDYIFQDMFHIQFPSDENSTLSEKETWFQCLKESIQTSIVESWLGYLFKLCEKIPEAQRQKIFDLCDSFFDTTVTISNKIKCFRLILQAWQQSKEKHIHIQNTCFQLLKKTFQTKMNRTYLLESTENEEQLNWVLTEFDKKDKEASST